ncbi:MAG: 3-isopropylmalate dehydrogenase [Ponticaulis sp.]|nr:3-isopropylmalate dehydrogenase [Ponticaulis sp.]|tara:strand:+ start:22238 stop:23317 length:1080 start_codon:yes stop_codon:yes gene_type:complete
MTQTLLLLPGDGIGPEVIEQTVRVAEKIAPDLALDYGLVGGASYDEHGTPLTDETLARAKAVDAVLMGSVGGPKWDSVARHHRPEAGLLNLRKGMDVYANLRPALCFSALADASALKRHLVEGLDILIVRELVGGVYFGQPKGIETLADGTRRGFDNAEYTTPEIHRITRVAFDIAKGRGNSDRRWGGVCSVEKSNVMDSGQLWKEEVQALYDAELKDMGVPLHHMLADACAMQLVREPKGFDVILADNLFGDMLSDEASMLTGSIGMLPSASLSDAGKPGLYEPVHGSAPDIAGQGKANPCAAILSLEMALRWNLGRSDAADAITQAVSNALDKGARTPDLGGEMSTSQMGDAILAEL